MASTDYRYDIALSFAEEDAAVADELRRRLTDRGYRVFSYRTHEGERWGADLAALLPDVFENQARHALLLISGHFVASEYARLELRHALLRHQRDLAAGYLLPVRMDETEIEELAPSIAWVPYRSLDDVAALVEQRLQPPHDLTLALDLYLELAPAASQDALESLVARRIRPFESSPGFSTALARFAVALAARSTASWDPAWRAMLPLFEAHAEPVSIAYAAAYPDVPPAVLQFLANVATPASHALFRRIAADGAEHDNFDFAVDWLLRHRTSENDAALRAAYERTPQNATLVRAMLVIGALGAVEARLRAAGYEERNLILGSANRRGITTFVPLMEERVAAGTFDEALLRHLEEAGSELARRIMKERERDAHAVEIGNGIDIFTRRSPDEIAERLEQLRQWRAEELENRRRLEELYDNPPSPDDVEDGYWDEHDHPRDYRRPPDPGEWLDAERDLDRMWNALELAAKHEPRFAERFRIIRSRVGRQ